MKHTSRPSHLLEIPAVVLDDVTCRIGTGCFAPQGRNAVLAGTTTETMTIVHFAVTDRDTDDERALKRRYARHYGLSLVGQVGTPDDALAAVLPHERPTPFSLPEGYAFVRLRTASGLRVVFGLIHRKGTLTPATVRIIHPNAATTDAVGRVAASLEGLTRHAR